MKTVTFVVELTKSDLGRLPRSTRAPKVMQPKKGKGSYRRDKRVVE